MNGTKVARARKTKTREGEVREEVREAKEDGQVGGGGAGRGGAAGDWRMELGSWVGGSPSITYSGGSTERTAVQGSAMAPGRARRQLGRPAPDYDLTKTSGYLNGKTQIMVEQGCIN